MELSTIPQFIKTIYKRLEDLGVNTSELVIDHLGYQANSRADYDIKVSKLQEMSNKLSENLVGGRRVGVFKISPSINYLNQSFDLVEIFEPREGQSVDSAWEHIEFLVTTSLEDFKAKYPKLDWDVSVLHRDEFPMLILALGNGMRAKFPRLSVEKEIIRIGNK